MIKQKQLLKLRNSNYELAQEKKFLDSQISNSRKNQERLLMNVSMINLDQTGDKQVNDKEIKMIKSK